MTSPIDAVKEVLSPDDSYGIMATTPKEKTLDLTKPFFCSSIIKAKIVFQGYIFFNRRGSVNSPFVLSPC